MNGKLRLLAVLALGCLAIGLSANALFNWYLGRDAGRLDEQLKAPAVAAPQPGILDSKVATPKDLLQALETPEIFRVMHRVSDIPSSVRIAFEKAARISSQEEVFSMAEPGSWTWNVGDVIHAGLPRRRLKAVAASNSHCLVFYEHGGFAKSGDVAVFRLSGQDAQAIWHSSLAPGVTNVAGLRKAIHGQPYGDALY